MKLEEFDGSKIQSLIGYHFKNRGLLTQAFTRSSYSAENPGYENNEALEFYGDVALNLYVSRLMAEQFGAINNGQYVSERNEGELSEIRSWYVNKHKLANCIKLLDIEKYLFMGKDDIGNKASESESVREDLFEAILGAVAVDSDWNFSDIKNTCETLFEYSKFEENYIELLTEECKKRGWGDPVIRDEGAIIRAQNLMLIHSIRSSYCWPSVYSPDQDVLQNNWHNVFGGNLSPVIQNLSLFSPSSRLSYETMWHPISFSEEDTNDSRKEEEFSIYIRELKSYFTEKGTTKKSSQLGAAKKFYEWLLRRDKILEVLKEVDENLAVNQLNELVQKAIIKNPEYSFKEEHDKEGNPIWKCLCKLKEADWPFDARNSSKKKVKQAAAAEALHYLVGEVATVNKKEEK